jgi:hypothetical protein
VHAFLIGNAKKYFLKKANLSLPKQPDTFSLLQPLDNRMPTYRYQRFGEIALQLSNETYSL